MVGAVDRGDKARCQARVLHRPDLSGSARVPDAPASRSHPRGSPALRVLFGALRREDGQRLFVEQLSTDVRELSLRIRREVLEHDLVVAGLGKVFGRERCLFFFTKLLAAEIEEPCVQINAVEWFLRTQRPGDAAHCVFLVKHRWWFRYLEGYAASLGLRLEAYREPSNPIRAWGKPLVKAIGFLLRGAASRAGAGRREQRIDEVEIDLTSGFPEKHIRTIQHVYGRAPYYREYSEELTVILRGRHRRLADLNIEPIHWLCRQFGIRTETSRSTALPVAGRRAELLVCICQHLRAQRYLSAEGSRAYIEPDNLFHRAGIDLVYHGYVHPVYRQQHGPFVPYLSAIDLLFNEGPRSLEILQLGRGGVSAWKSAAP